jgi:uncharacterized protein involved in response to NO
MKNVAQPRMAYFSMCREEPFRVFFPLGLACGLAGLALWPLHFWGAMTEYPAFLHVRLMIEGFIGAFVIGFLGTAGPRLLEARPLASGEYWTLLGLHLFSIAAHLGRYFVIGDSSFALALASLAGFLSHRFAKRGNLPPPSFVLVAFGLLSGVAGSALLAWTTCYPSSLALYSFSLLALNQGFALLPVLGVGAFIFPRTLGLSEGDECLDSRRAKLMWNKKAGAAAATALVIIVALALEGAGQLRAAGALKFLTAAFYVIGQMRPAIRWSRAPFQGQCIRIAIWCLLLGLLWEVVLPQFRVAGLHLVFIGGFMLIVFVVAARVVLGHSGQAHLCSGRLPGMITTFVLLMLAIATRISADFLPSVAGRNVHLVYAAILCIGAALVWGAIFIPRVFIADAEE